MFPITAIKKVQYRQTLKMSVQFEGQVRETYAARLFQRLTVRGHKILLLKHFCSSLERHLLLYEISEFLMNVLNNGA